VNSETGIKILAVQRIQVEIMCRGNYAYTDKARGRLAGVNLSNKISGE